jgi:hypothetical protein
MYFPCFLCKFSRGEPVDKAGGGVMCTTSKGTCSYLWLRLINLSKTPYQVGDSKCFLFLSKGQFIKRLGD